MSNSSLLRMLIIVSCVGALYALPVIPRKPSTQFCEQSVNIAKVNATSTYRNMSRWRAEMAIEGSSWSSETLSRLGDSCESTPTLRATLSEQCPQIFEIELVAPEKIEKIKFNAYTHVSRPADYILQGSMNRTGNWENLISVNHRDSALEHDVHSRKAYKYLRIRVTTTKGKHLRRDSLSVTISNLQICSEGVFEENEVEVEE